MEEIRIDWSGAEVDGGELTVPLSAEVPKEWQGHLEQALALMGVKRVTVKKRKLLKVDGVQAGEEERVHALLEGVVEQANASCGAEAPAREKGHQGPSEELDEDARLTDAYRSFASR